jgi:uncharacterized membrane protein
MENRLLQITRTALFVALGVAMGYAHVVPNIELVTATIFIGGFLLGIKEGAFIGTAAEGIYSLFNPYGAPSLPLWLAQVISMAIAGSFGGILGKKISLIDKKQIPTIGMAGFLITLNFDVLTTLSFVFTMAFTLKQIVGSFVFGLSFYLTHIISNTVIFFTLVPVILNALRKWTNPIHLSTQGKQP